MTDSLARIRAEQDADVALESAHPDPLSIAGELQARAADRCARKREVWSAGHCQGCPFMGCYDCAFQGGVDPNAPVAQRDSGATRRDNRTDVRDNRGEPLKRPPDGAGNTAEGLATTQLQGSSKEES